MQVKIHGEEIQAALQKLVDAYPGGRCDIWVRANDRPNQIDYVAYVMHLGTSGNNTGPTPAAAAEKVIKDFKPRSQKERLLDQLADINSKLAELEAAQ